MLRFVRRETAAAAAAPPPEGDVLAALLHARGIHGASATQAFLHPALAALHDPMLLSGMQPALALLAQAKAERWPVLVYGDYDVDGVCATALMSEALSAYGLSVTPHVPLRAEGYGLNLPAMERFAADFPLMVTVDLGITNAAEVTHAQALGMRVIVTDHHQPGLAPCPADAVVNPLLGGYPFARLCGAGVAFKIACALHGLEVAAQWLDLAALATVADIVPLVDENRVLVAHGLSRMAQRPGLKALLDVAGSAIPPAADTLAYQIAPRLNAAGRIADANAGVRLLLTRDQPTADALAHDLNQANTERKRIEADTAEQALRQAQGHDFVRNRVLFVRGQGWHTGVVGLVAGRLNQRFGVPVCALSEEDGVLHGSLRGVKGVNLAHCLQTCDALLTRYGGHEMAAGVTLPAENDAAFRAGLERVVRLSAPEEAFVPAKEYDLAIALHQADDALVDALALMAPFGFGNPAPVFLTEGAQLLRRRAVGANGAHLQLTLGGAGRLMDGIAFGLGEEAARLPDVVDAAYTLAWETFMGRTAIKCQVQAIRPAPAAQAAAIAAAGDAPGHMPLLRALLRALQAPLPVAGNCASDAELLNAVPFAQGAQNLPDPQAAQGAQAAAHAAQAGAQTILPAGQTGAQIMPAAQTVPAAQPAALTAPVGAHSAPPISRALPPIADAPAFPLPPAVRAALTGRQGTLLIAFARSTAAQFLDAYGALVDVAYGAPEDPRCFHTLLLDPEPWRLAGSWHTAVLLDGSPAPHMAALLRQALPGANVIALPVSPGLRQAAAAIDAGDDAYRDLYKTLRSGAFGRLMQAAGAARLTEAQTLAGLTAFQSLGLIDFAETPFHYTLRAPTRCSLGQSPVLGALRALIA